MQKHQLDCSLQLCITFFFSLGHLLAADKFQTSLVSADSIHLKHSSSGISLGSNSGISQKDGTHLTIWYMVCVKYWWHGVSAITFIVCLTIVGSWWDKMKPCCLPSRDKFVCYFSFLIPFLPQNNGEVELGIGLTDLHVRDCKDIALNKATF